MKVAFKLVLTNPGGSIVPYLPDKEVIGAVDITIEGSDEMIKKVMTELSIIGEFE